MSGDLAQGAQVGEAQLAERLGVSRGPLREAMQRLVQEGLLHSIPHRGLFVVELSDEDVEDIYTARMAVESAAVLSILRRDDADRVADRLDKAVAKMSGAAERGDTQALSRSDLAFHELLVSESGSVRLQRMASTLLLETRMCMAALPHRYVVPGDLVTEHVEIVRAIRERDRDRAMKVIDEHMGDAVGRLSIPAAEPADA
ncbi:MAG: FCD domain-containing protein [Propionibacteriales bacterium]|nr:FCD domain-containing protein [Propionibacteriales bacterium]